MEIIRKNNAEKYEPQDDWVRSNLCNQADISIEHFVKPPKHSSPTHNHPNSQVLYVLEGTIIIKTDADEQRLEQGDCAYISSGEIHTVINPSDKISVGLDIFIPGRSFDFWLNKINPK